MYSIEELTKDNYALKEDIKRLKKENQHLIEQAIIDNKQYKELKKKKEFYKTEHNRFKEEILSIFTHELQTPLNIIINYSRHIFKNLERRGECKKNTLLKLSKEIYKHSIKQHRLIEQILNIIDLKKLQTNIENTDFTKMLSCILKKKGEHKILFDIDNKIVKTDKDLLYMIVDELLTNAYKYAKSTIKISFKVENKNSFKIIIEDDGKGISDKNKENIFELFNQGSENYLSRDVKNSLGVGLYKVKLICDILNGNILVEDSNLGGAKFICDFSEEGNSTYKL